MKEPLDEMPESQEPDDRDNDQGDIQHRADLEWGRRSPSAGRNIRDKPDANPRENEDQRGKNDGDEQAHAPIFRTNRALARLDGKDTADY